jgi:hypothetical protein
LRPGTLRKRGKQLSPTWTSPQKIWWVRFISTQKGVLCFFRLVDIERRLMLKPGSKFQDMSFLSPGKEHSIGVACG